MENKKIQIYITSWFRPDMLKKTIEYIIERTTPETYLINVYDNGSDKMTTDMLYQYLEMGKINTLVLDKRNTGCLYNKLVFHSMVESTDKYYCVTDNDVYPPKLSPDWLSRMVDIMERHPKIGLLTPQLPPQFLQMPYRIEDEVIYAKAVGNTFKLVRKACLDSVIMDLKQELGSYGDDGIVSGLLRAKGWDVAFCKDIFCFHAGQCEKWGYTEDQVSLDPRKIGYGKPFTYGIVNEETYEPEPRYRM